MSNTAIKVENLSKIYRLGEIGTGTISRDMERWFKTKVLKQEDPFLKIGETNDRTNKGKSDIVYTLQDINFEVEQGDAVGIIGRNGAGKSTLLKILSRVTTPTTGRINIKGRVASLLEVGTGFHPELTGRENIYLNGAILGMRKREIDRKLNEIIDFSGVERYIDTPVKRYSSGMYVRLAFAVAAHLESEILIVDEVLAVGDAEFQKKCLGKMGEVSKGEGRTVLFVSHNLTAVQSLCGKGILLENGCLSSSGLINDIVSNYVKSSSFNNLSYTYPDAGIQSTINTGVLRFNRISINSNLQSLEFEKSIICFLEIESYSQISDCILDVRILNREMVLFGHSSNAYNDINIHIQKGKNVCEVEIANHLQPGNYFFTIGVHKRDGETLDYIENLGPIEVTPFNTLNNQKFPLNPDWDLGNIRINSEWKLQL